ncbi:MAG TPA: hypothetical protein VHE14_03590 [Solirubrobacteraceae bacterium]|nr:hypothetical protein [Solirubrobacteraceae bacterium]
MTGSPDAPQPDDEVADALRALGIGEDAIARAVERGDPQAAIFEAVLLPGISERTVSAAEIEQRGGVSVAQTQAMMEAFGVPVHLPDEPAFTPQEARVFIELKQLEDVWPPDVALQISRVYGRQLGRIAQAAIQLFRAYVEPRLLAAGDGQAAALDAVQQAFARLLPLSDPLLVGVHRRWVEHELAQIAVSDAEVGVGGEALPGAVNVALLFCDLKDFTALAQTEGDAAAVAAIDRFAATVTRERGGEFHFMKMLGDGAMLAYRDVVPAVAAGARIIDAMRPQHSRGVHASVHHGIAIAREGDYFGGAVNLAARLLDVAGRDELLASRHAAERCSDAFAWEPAGVHELRGVTEPVEAFRLTAS